MKKNLHPERVECTITCACGNSFKTISNKPSHFVESCNKCNPAYNENMKKITKKDGNVDKFKKKYNLD